MRDEDVPAWWGALGLPGLVDTHVHFLPERVMAAVWRFFDEARERYGVSWPVTYRTSDAERTATLRTLGVRIYPALVYPHKPGMAESLNAWAREFAADTPGCVASGTFYPEPSVDQYVRAALEAGTRIFKVHVQVGEFDPGRPPAGPGMGTARRRGHARGGALRQWTDPRSPYRAGAYAGRAAPAPAADRRDRPLRNAGVRRAHRTRRALPERAP